MSAFFSEIQRAKWFSVASLGCILTAAVLAGMETYPGLNRNFSPLFQWLDFAILVYFVFEIMVRLGALNWDLRSFIRKPWNVFDFVIIILCLIPFASFDAAVIRLIRILRALRLLSGIPELRHLIEAFLKSLSSISYVGILLLVLFYIYGVLGVGLFAGVNPGHFGNLGLSFFTLFQLVTLEGWVDILGFHRTEAGYSFSALLYYISFIIMGTMVVLNLLIGVIVNSMENVRLKNDANEKEHPKPLAASQKTFLINEIRDLKGKLEKIEAALKS